MRVPNDLRLVKECGGGIIDLVLGGHDHDYVVHDDLKPILVKSGTDFRQLSEIRIQRNNEMQVIRKDISNSVIADEEMKSIVSTFTSGLSSKLSLIIGTTSVALDSRFSTVRRKESNIGNFVSDIMRTQTGADVALLNSGTLRSDTLTPAGNLRLSYLFRLVPMSDALVTVQVSGKQLIEALENGVSQYPNLEGRFPQVSGMKFSFDPANNASERVLVDSVMILSDGVDLYEPIVLDKLYSVVTKQYIANGNDGYVSLTQGKLLISSEESPTLPCLLRNHFSMLSVLNGFKQSKRLKECNLTRIETTIREGLEVYRKRKASTSERGEFVFPSSCHQTLRNRYTIRPRVEGRITILT